MQRVLAGGLAGTAATGTMSAAMWAAKQAGLMHRPPPKEITARAASATGLGSDGKDGTRFQLSWMAAHVAYGAGTGVLYSFVRQLLPGPPLLRGALYGLAVWAAGYLGYLPALGLYPPPGRDSTSRTAVMIGVHLVYGGTLGQVEARFR